MRRINYVYCFVAIPKLIGCFVSFHILCSTIFRIDEREHTSHSALCTLHSTLKFIMDEDECTDKKHNANIEFLSHSHRSSFIDPNGDHINSNRSQILHFTCLNWK